MFTGTDRCIDMHGLCCTINEDITYFAGIRICMNMQLSRTLSALSLDKERPLQTMLGVCL
jgi:hypothetical protein